MGAAINAQHAKVIDSVAGTLPSGRWEGKAFTMQLRESNDGKTRFVKLVIGDDYRRSFQYTGRNFAAAAQQLSEMRDALKVTP